MIAFRPARSTMSAFRPARSEGQKKAERKSTKNRSRTSGSLKTAREREKTTQSKTHLFVCLLVIAYISRSNRRTHMKPIPFDSESTCNPHAQEKKPIAPAIMYYTDDGHDDTSLDAPSFDLVLVPPSEDPKPSNRVVEEQVPSSMGSEAPKASGSVCDDPKPSSSAFDDPKPSSSAFDDPKPSSLPSDDPKPSSLPSDDPKPSTQASEEQRGSILAES
ncbi:hypothetical protein Y032_0150g2744 [Ancylostoma ceylanicum]|uniref:Uncharacterized protein n=1 Tax=Ancylostoma ceylanicum TaxID=53326 RepID=A0A016T098_9BILA|nr:hypothetical protein Y032_0150g2744 [Ancylostoma ceylanicum]